MTFLVPLTLFGWIPAVIYLFLVLPPRRAVIAAFLIAWLFLPMAGYKVAGLPDYTKMSATVFGVVLAASLFDPDRLLRFRPRWIDLPAAVFCLSPSVTSMLNQINGSGFYDGLSVALTQIVTWGLPYLIGRAYFDDLESLKELAIGIFIGGLVYMPLCWIEMRLSPQLHVWFYGFHQHDFSQTIRFGGYRPMVFMQHGLMVAMWMAMCTLVGFWLWISGTLQKIFDFPLSILVGLLFLTSVGCRSIYATLLLLLGIVVLITAKWFQTKWLVVAVLLVPPTFMIVRGSGMVDGKWAVQTAKEIFGAERGGSLETRVIAENVLAEKAREQPWFGWGGWGRSRVVNEETGNDYITDSLWIITFGEAGIINLAALTLMILLPMILIIRDYRVSLWSHPMVAPAVVLAMMNALYMLDHLMNGMVNPIFMLAVGGICAAHYHLPKRLPVPELYRAMQQRRVPVPATSAFAMRPGQ